MSLGRRDIAGPQGRVRHVSSLYGLLRATLVLNLFNYRAWLGVAAIVAGGVVFWMWIHPWLSCLDNRLTFTNISLSLGAALCVVTMLAVVGAIMPDEISDVEDGQEPPSCYEQTPGGIVHMAVWVN